MSGPHLPARVHSFCGTSILRYLDTVAPIWTPFHDHSLALIRLRKWVSPILALNLGPLYSRLEFGKTFWLVGLRLLYPCGYGLWHCLLGFLLSANTFLGISLRLQLALLVFFGGIFFIELLDC